MRGALFWMRNWPYDVFLSVLAKDVSDPAFVVVDADRGPFGPDLRGDAR